MVHLAGEITSLLQNWQKGDPDSLNRVIAEVYLDLKKMAAYQMAKESSSHTLQPTALVNEAYLRLIANRRMKFPDRKCFFMFVGMLMRRILVEYARGKTSKKRGGSRKKVALALEEALPAKQWDPALLLALDEALTRLKNLDPRKHELIEMWFFVGLDAHEIGKLFTRSPITIRRELRAAKYWLARALEKEGKTMDDFFAGESPT